MDAPVENGTAGQDKWFSTETTSMFQKQCFDNVHGCSYCDNNGTLYLKYFMLLSKLKVDRSDIKLQIIYLFGKVFFIKQKVAY